MILIFIAGGAFLLYLLQFFVYRHFWDQGLQVSLRFATDCVYEKETVLLEEIVENHKRLPLPLLKVKFRCSRYLQFEKVKNAAVTDFYYRNDVFTALPMKRIIRELPFVCTKRGYYGIRGIDLLSTDLFMSKNFIAERESETTLYVLPRPYKTRELTRALQKINGEVLAKRHLLEDPFENRGIREYQPYDTMRNINWKATAKTGSLMVNQKNYTSLKAVRIFLNLDDHAILRREELLEVSIRIAAELAQCMLAQGMRVSVYSNTADVLTGQCLEIGDSAGAGHLEVILKGLARIDLDKPAFSFQKLFLNRLCQDDNGTFTVVISPNVYKEFQQNLLTYREYDSDFFWICPRDKYEAKEEVELLEGLEKNFLPLLHERE